MDMETLAKAVIDGDRRALARAITKVESQHPDHRKEAIALISAARASGREALRIGLSGTPGVGKSTFIESFGMMLIGAGLRVAVLAVDPSSARSGGSIMGDKTRMEHLSRSPQAFIRPSPSAAQMGGLARRTREAVSLCEAAGFDVILIETVGVGQSETMVSELCDVFLLLMAPAGGDELQGVKRGIMEMADMILVNKADGDLRSAALRTCADYGGALRLLRRRHQDPEGFPKALTVSALDRAGIAQTWAEVNTLIQWRKDNGKWQKKRSEQALYWFEQEIRQGILSILDHGKVKSAIADLGTKVSSGNLNPDHAAHQVIALARSID